MRQRNGERSAERNVQGGPVPSYWSQPRTDITPLREGGATSQQVQCMPRLFDRCNRVQNSLSSPSDIVAPEAFAPVLFAYEMCT